MLPFGKHGDSPQLGPLKEGGSTKREKTLFASSEKAGTVCLAAQVIGESGYIRKNPPT